MARFVVRYGVMRMVGVFSSRLDNHRRGALVIARTTRGLEAGEVLCEATEQAVAQLVDPPSGQILREMTPEDVNEVDHLKTREKDEFELCDKHVRRPQARMQLVDVEHLFGGERIVIYYLAEDRVDFRELVKALAGEFQTRIEMRQIGVRDEAKLLADYGDCGKPVCCNTHLVEMPPVSMKMAKLQKATLDPTKISGRCGRLKCCLRYEYDTYEDLLQDAPPDRRGGRDDDRPRRILNHEILAQQLLIQTEDNRRLLIPAADVLSIIHAGTAGGGRGRGERGDRGERGERRGRGGMKSLGEPGESGEKGEQRGPVRRANKKTKLVETTAKHEHGVARSMRHVSARIRKLLEEDRRYTLGAYQFIQDALLYAPATCSSAPPNRPISAANRTIRPNQRRSST